MIVEVADIGIEQSKIIVRAENVKEQIKYHGIKNFWGFHKIETFKLTQNEWKEYVVYCMEEYAKEWMERRDRVLNSPML